MPALLDAAKNAYLDLKWRLHPQQMKGGHKGVVYVLALFDNGRRVVTGSNDHTLRIWDVQKEAFVGGPFKGHKRSVYSVAVSPDDRRIVSGGRDKTVIIWDVMSKKKLFDPLLKHTDDVNSVCFSPDGNQVASGSDDRTVVIWDAGTGTVLVTLEGHRGLVWSVAFSPDGRKLASGSSDKRVRVWSTDNAELLLKIVVGVTHEFWVPSVVWSSDGHQLTSLSDDNVVKFWNASNGRQVGQPCIGHTGWISSLAISPDGSFIATASQDGTVRLWSTITHQQIGQADRFTRCVAISPNGALLACSSDLDGVGMWSIWQMLKRDGGLEGQIQEIQEEQKPHIAGIPQVQQSPEYSQSLGVHVQQLQLQPPPQAQPAHHAQSSLGLGHTLVEKKPHTTGILQVQQPPKSPAVHVQKQLPQLPSQTQQQSQSVSPPRIFNPNETSPDTNVQAWAQYYAQGWTEQGWTEPSGSVYLISAPGVKDASSPLEQTPQPNQPPYHGQAQHQLAHQSHSLVPPEAILQNLTTSITKVGGHAVARGGFGEVWKCILQTERGPIDVGVKALLVYASDEDEGLEKKTKRIRRELRTCARLKHKNILPVFGYTYGFGLIMALVCPWAQSGNLTTYLERENATLTIVRRFQILIDVSTGLQYLHANNVIHGDLTGPNILIHGDGTACLADFGLSLMYSEVITKSAASWTSAFHGNFRWLAPELLGHSDDEVPVRPSKHSDIYSFGGVMLQVLTSKVPYYYLPGDAAVAVCIYTGVKPSRSRYPEVSDDYWCFLEECWSAETHRPSAERVVEVISNEFDSSVVQLY